VRAFLSVGMRKSLPQNEIDRNNLPILRILSVVAHQLASARKIITTSTTSSPRTA
jgi:hypothetical protein